MPRPAWPQALLLWGSPAHPGAHGQRTEKLRGGWGGAGRCQGSQVGQGRQQGREHGGTGAAWPITPGEA